MIKVLLVGPNPSKRGGISVWVGLVLDYFKNDPDTQVTLLGVKRSATLTHLLSLPKRLWFSIKDYCAIYYALAKELKRNQYDIVHITSSAGYGIIRDFLFARLTHHNNSKVILHYHCGHLPDLFKGRRVFFRRLFIRTTRISSVVVLDENTEQTLINNGINNVVRIGNPYNNLIDSLNNIPTKRDNSELLFVGHLVYEKGIRELLYALNEIPNIHLKCIGPEDTNLKKEFEAYISNHGLSNRVSFEGVQEPCTVFQSMSRAGIFVLPTYSEGFPFVIVEAMACGCPVISTPVGAIPEMLTTQEGVQGYLVPSKDPVSLTKTINYCLNHRDEIMQKARIAKDKANKEYSTQAIMNRLKSFWISII